MTPLAAPLDEGFFDFARLSVDERRAGALQDRLIRAAFQFHLKHNEGYRHYCARLGVDADSVRDLQLTSIPTLPSSFFKPNRRPTLPFNGYAEQVAGLYAGMDLRRHF